MANFITGSVGQDQTAHWGARLNIQAVLTREWLRENRACIPSKYRRYATGEVRIKPIELNLIPREIVVSPDLEYNTTGIYGIGWNLFGIGVAPIQKPFRFGFRLGLPVKYMYIHSDTLPSPTHFLRPGLEASVELEIPFSKNFLMSVGWVSQLFPPQPVGGSIIEITGLQDSIWHIGQAFLKFHIRVPYETSSSF